MIKKHGRSSLPGLALCCALLNSACPLLGSQPDAEAAREAVDTLGSLDLAIVYQAQVEDLWPFPVAHASYDEGLSRLRLEIDGRAFSLAQGSGASAVPVAAGSIQLLELFWDGSLIWKGSSTARPAPAGVSCSPDLILWLADKDSTLAVSWQAVGGADSYECRLVASADYLAEFPFGDGSVWNDTGAALWWTAIPEGSQESPLLSVRAIDSEVILEDSTGFDRFTIRTFGAATYLGAGAAQKDAR